MDEREMFDEINALIGAVAAALEIGEMEVVTAIEEGRLGLEMLTDEEGRNYIDAKCDGKNVRVYPGAIFRPGDKPKPGDAATDEPHEEGCACGH